ncbi:MAG: flagellar motor protein MotA [Alphaproteobacteria bacterium]|nr:flagellar motor protein MotA [Alphaproteobacteria bacterium]
MTRPQRFLTRMALFLAAVAGVSALLFMPMQRAFLANPLLNGLILLVLLFGIGFIFRQVFLLRTEVEWLNNFRRPEPGISLPPAPRLLAPMAAMFGDRNQRISFSTLSTRSLLDSISARLDEEREISRYLIGLMIFLGLLGTFWGLLETVSSVGETIRALAPESSDFGQLFAQLKSGLEHPLSGMGTAFSSSLFGLAGSLVLGFLDLQAGQAQNRFYNEFEEWLASQTKITRGGLAIEADASVPAYVQALLEQTADSLDNLQRTIARGEDARNSANHALLQLSERLATLGDQMRAEQSLLVRLAESQMELKPVLAKLAGAQDMGGLDEASRTHLRNLDVYATRMLEELREGRQQLSQEMRSEIRLLTRTIAALADEERKG